MKYLCLGYLEPELLTQVSHRSKLHIKENNRACEFLRVGLESRTFGCGLYLEHAGGTGAGSTCLP